MTTWRPPLRPNGLCSLRSLLFNSRQLSVVVLALAAGLCGALAQAPVLRSNVVSVLQGITNMPARNPMVASGYVPDDKYKLRAGDRVSFAVLEDRDLPVSLVVSDSGELEVPYIGRRQVADKTCKQVVQELKVELEKDFYHRATVILALDVANKLWGRVYVWGEVKTQGPIEVAINENITASRAILRAGGFADFANKKKVKVVRAGSAGGTVKQHFEVNMVEILEEGKTEEDIPLQPDDAIIVPSRTVNF